MSASRNEAVKRHILDPANCHCTYRVLITGNKAHALCSESGIIRAIITWRHHENRTVIYWAMPHATSHHRKFNRDATDEKIDEVITDGFVEMDCSFNLAQ